MTTKPSRISTLFFSAVRCLIGILLTSLFFTSTNNAQSQLFDQITSDDLYWIIENGRFGFIDSKGVVVIKPQFLMVDLFSEGLAAVLVGDLQKQKTAFIDTKGRIVFETNDSPSEKGFSSGVAVLLADHTSDHYYVNKKERGLAGIITRRKIVQKASAL